MIHHIIAGLPILKKWYLITSLDDYSRYMLLYADIMEKETTWRHITLRMYG